MLAGGVAAHTVANDDERVEAGLIAPDRDRILVLLSFQARIGGPRDT